MSIPLETLKFVIFSIDLFCLYILLIGVIWSVLSPKRRIWPPPKKASWQYILTWFLFYMVFLLNFVLLLMDWNSWIFTESFRFFIAVPLIILGGMLFSWGIITLGTKNTSGIKDQFITNGPYRYTRNPQYLGDCILFFGIIILSNSLIALITHALLILVFLITPWAEEHWLEKQYGEIYEEYKKVVPRFI